MANFEPERLSYEEELETPKKEQTKNMTAIYLEINRLVQNSGPVVKSLAEAKKCLKLCQQEVNKDLCNQCIASQELELN